MSWLALLCTLSCGSTASDPIYRASAGGMPAIGGAGGSGAGGDSSGGAGLGVGGAMAGNGGGTSGKGASGSGTGGAGAAGGGGAACLASHPVVNGTERSCNAGACYCSDKDACFAESEASSCCVATVVCGSGADSPVVTINHPGDGEQRAAGSDIPFVGLATDPQDGALTGSALVWSSDLAGVLGSGETVNTSLAAGTHRITLTATDADSNVGTDAITLIVE
jgi:hypothetical protein